MTPRPGSDTPEAEPNGHNPSDSTPSGTATERIIERFGGIRPMAHKLDMPVTTVQGWKKRGAIPLSRHADLRAAAVKHGITLDEADLEAATPAEDRHGTAPAADDKPAEDKIADSKAADAAETTAAPSEPVTVPPATAAEPEKPAEPAEEERERARTYSLPPRPAEQKSGGAGFATAVSLLALLVGAAALTERWWAPMVPGWSAPPAQTAAAPANDGALRAQLQQLAERVGKLEQRPATASNGASNGAAADVQALAGKVAALEQRAAAPANGTADAVKALADRLAALEQKAGSGEQAAQQAQQLAQRIAGLEQKVGANAAAAQEVGALKQEVAGLAKQAEGRRDAAATAQALVLAAGQLRGALAGSQPFQGELQAVQALGLNDPQVKAALDAVAPHAAKGIPTQAQLAERFEPLANDIVKAAQKGEGANWIDQVTGTLSTLVTVRRQGGGIVGDTPDATVARAEAAINQGNLAVAVEELSKLQGPAAQAAAGWLADARARLAANQAAQQLTGRAIAALTAAGGAKPEGAQ